VWDTLTYFNNEVDMRAADGRQVMSLRRPARESVQLLLVGAEDWIETVAATFEDGDASVSAVATVEEALARLRKASADVDSVVGAYDLPEANGVRLLEELGTIHPRLPVVLYPLHGDEGVASEAIGAGVTD
jgi:DNA-binding NtrC family response regulator